MEWFSAIFIAWSILLALGCLIELGFYYYDGWLGKWNPVSPSLHSRRQGNLILIWFPALPLLVSSLVFILSQLSSIRHSAPHQELDQQSTIDDESESINADIAGDGVRYAMLIQVVALAVAALMGFFHRNQTGVKGLGICILIILAYLTINLWSSYSSLVWVERVVVCMQVDALIAALSLTFSDKETLSSRWFIRSAVACQFAAISAVGFVMSTLQHVATTGPSTFRVFWSVSFENNQPVPSVFWLYFALRILNELHNAWLALTWTGFFDKAEHDCDIEQRLQQYELNPGGAENLNRDISALILHEFYNSRAATVFTKCIPQIVFSTVPLIGIEALVAQCKNVKGAEEWGQRAAVIVPALGMLQWCFFQGQHVYRTKWSLSAGKFVGSLKIIYEADKLRADAHLKRTFVGLLREFGNNPTNDILGRAIRIADEMLTSALEKEDVTAASKAIHSGARLQIRHNMLYVGYTTPLRKMVKEGNVQIVEALLAPNRGDTGSEPIYSTPMVLAAKLKLRDLTERAEIRWPEVVASVVDVMSTERKCSDNQMKILMLLTNDTQVAGETSESLLTCAVSYRNREMLEELLAQKIDVNALTNVGTVLDLVLNKRSDAPKGMPGEWTTAEYDEVIELLISKGAITKKDILLRNIEEGKKEKKKKI